MADSADRETLLRLYDFDDYSRRLITFYYCQAGFHPQGYKPVYVWTRQEFQNGEARVWKDGDASSVTEVPITRQGLNIWGRQDWIIDVTEVTAPGDYIVEAEFNGETAKTDPIPIKENLYEDLMQKAAKHYFLKRCGIFCHTQDAYLYSLDEGDFGEVKAHIDVSGGWHDAHDDNKWVVFVWMALYALLRLEETLRPQWHNTNEPYPYCLAEAWWEIDWLLRMQKPDGTFYYAVWEWAPKRTDDKMLLRIHDPDVQNYDDLGRDKRAIIDLWEKDAVTTILGAPKGSSPSTAPKYLAYLAHVIRCFGRLIRPYDDMVARRCREAAEKTVLSLEALDRFPPYQEIEVHAGLALYYLECARDRGGPEALEKAECCLEKVLARQRPEGYFHASARCQGLEFHPEEAGDERVFVDYPFAYVLPIIEYLNLAEESKGPPFRLRDKARQSLLSFAEMLAGFCQATVFRQPTECRFDGQPEIILSRAKVNHGYNPYILSAGVVFAAAARLLGNPQWRKLAEQQMHWVLGANPRFMSFMNQVGVRNCGQYAAASSVTAQYYLAPFYRHLRDMRWGVATGVYGALARNAHYLPEINTSTPQHPNYPNAGLSMIGRYDAGAQETWLNTTGWFLMLLVKLARVEA